jgi:hypothetical protein
VHQGVKLFISTNALENLPAFANAKDSDNDGMPDVWEDANLFNKFSAADATQMPTATVEQSRRVSRRHESSRY